MIPQLDHYLKFSTSTMLLDLGSGLCKSPISSQLLDLPLGYICHVDGYQPDLLSLAKKPYRAKRASFYHHDLRQPLPFGLNSFHIALALDVIEHLPKERGLSLLKEMGRVASRQVLVFLPLGDCPALIGDDERGNEFQEHRSVWEATDLVERGYTVEVLENFHRLHLGTFDAAIATKEI